MPTFGILIVCLISKGTSFLGILLGFLHNFLTVVYALLLVLISFISHLIQMTFTFRSPKNSQNGRLFVIFSINFLTFHIQPLKCNTRRAIFNIRVIIQVSLFC